MPWRQVFWKERKSTSGKEEGRTLGRAKLKIFIVKSVLVKETKWHPKS
jgi:hypothetical protein